ncbi:helix-turn-helix domain-containing protein [Promicromonospora thailandica]|uniref:AraC-type DNA-binding protein n=1 Tax=Promicromonospora thailandica TaxID=765201 RepID=A0A9X2G5M6_9MICO|nr:helix-turn-helix domain-containing protein [Promicromonospora thailandica]MCP2265782.1 AraC-type DNA-binding protein [Promicromonospora thailandica]BFF21805.1 AraC family transcriptional regulator [Promicromonospora thailandica]
MTHGTAPDLPAALAPYVTAVVPYDLDMGPPGVHRGMPGPGLTFELPLDEPLDVAWAGQDGSRRQVWSCVSGLHTRPAAIHHRGHQHGISVSLTLRGARALLGMPAGELAGELTSLAEVAPHLAHLPELLADSPTPATVARVLAEHLARAEEPGPRADVGRALAVIARGGQVRDAAAEQGWSRRHLQDLVRAECGLTPRDLRRVARLARSRGALVVAARSGRVTLADVAASAGYADHAHMTREWVALAGCTPSTWLREELPYVQDVADPARPSWETPEHAPERGGPR